jgi:hypothetical protein
MSSESVCQVARSWVDVGSFHMCLVVRCMNFTASVWNILGTSSYMAGNISFVIYLTVLSIAQIIIGCRMTEANKLEKMCVAAVVNY